MHLIAQLPQPPKNDIVCFTGQATGFNAEARDRDLPFTAKDEPATLPRVGELMIITEFSPWCTIVKNPAGVTMNDICTTVWKEYVDHLFYALGSLTEHWTSGTPKTW